MEKLIITGATGLIGSKCLKALKDKYELYAIVRGNRKTAEGAKIFECDILNYSKMVNIIKDVKPDKILHLAWVTDHKKYLNSPKNVDWVLATYKFMSAFYENGGKHAVVSGTCFEYDLDCGVLDEDTTPLNPNSIYGKSKNYCREILTLLSKEYEKSLAWGRIFYVYGGNENRNRIVPYILDTLKAGDVAVCGSGEQVRDYLYINDVVSALICLLENNVDGVFNICAGNTTKIKELVNVITERLNKRDCVRFDKSKDRENEPPVIIGLNHKLKNLGWIQRFSIEDGVKDMIESNKL